MARAVACAILSAATGNVTSDPIPTLNGYVSNVKNAAEWNSINECPHQPSDQPTLSLASVSNRKSAMAMKRKRSYSRIKASHQCAVTCRARRVPLIAMFFESSLAASWESSFSKVQLNVACLDTIELLELSLNLQVVEDQIRGTFKPY